MMHEKLKPCCRLQKMQPTKCLSHSWCVLCKNNEEDQWHLLFNCPFALACWSDLFLTFNVSGCFPNNAASALLQLSKGITLTKKKKKKRISFGLVGLLGWFGDYGSNATEGVFWALKPIGRFFDRTLEYASPRGSLVTKFSVIMVFC